MKLRPTDGQYCRLTYFSFSLRLSYCLCIWRPSAFMRTRPFVFTFCYDDHPSSFSSLSLIRLLRPTEESIMELFEFVSNIEISFMPYPLATTSLSPFRPRRRRRRRRRRPNTVRFALHNWSLSWDQGVEGTSSSANHRVKSTEEKG